VATLSRAAPTFRDRNRVPSGRPALGGLIGACSMLGLIGMRASLLAFVLIGVAEAVVYAGAGAVRRHGDRVRTCATPRPSTEPSTCVIVRWLGEDARRARSRRSV
jgi:hypothetical protein